MERNMGGSGRGAVCWALALLSAAGLGLGGLASAENARPTLTPDSGPIAFDSYWGDANANLGETEILFDPPSHSSSGGADVVLIAKYPFGEGRLHGCYDPDARVLLGVWTQTAGAPVCDEAVERRRIWGRFRFVFSPDGQSFEGEWTSCEEQDWHNWDGYLQPTAIQAPDLRDPVSMLERMPICDQPTA